MMKVNKLMIPMLGIPILTIGVFLMLLFWSGNQPVIQTVDTYIWWCFGIAVGALLVVLLLLTRFIYKLRTSSKNKEDNKEMVGVIGFFAVGFLIATCLFGYTLWFTYHA